MAAENPDDPHYAPPNPLVGRSTNIYHDSLNTLELPHDFHDPNYSRWFDSSLMRGDGKSKAQIRENNNVVGLVEGETAFKYMVEAIQTAQSKGHFIYLLGWSLCYDLVLDGKNTINSLFTEAGSKGVEIRVMLSGHLQSGNDTPVEHLNTIADCGAVLDNRRCGTFGSHHQKILVVKGSQGLFAFCGGVDIYFDRIAGNYHGYCGDNRPIAVPTYHDVPAYAENPDDFTLHRDSQGRLMRMEPDPVDPNGDFRTSSGSGNTQGAPLHDVHCRIQGPAALDLLNIFVERWKDNLKWKNDFNQEVDRLRSPSYSFGEPTSPLLINKVEVLPPAKRSLLGETLSEAAAPAAGKVYIQIGRTYGNCTKHGTHGPFSFAPNGEQTAKKIILHAIGQAETLIYMEDQYMVSMEASNALKKALQSKPKLKVAILIPDTKITDMPHARSHRQEFVDNLKPYYAPDNPDSPQSRVAICTLKPAGSPRTYVHAKTYVMDDKLAIIGSANCNRRSWTNDSEVVAAIYDASADDKRTIHFAHNLRIKLWAMHLQKSEHECFDPGSFAHWLKPPENSHIEPFNRDHGDGSSYLKELSTWSIVDPDGS